MRKKISYFEVIKFILVVFILGGQFACSKDDKNIETFNSTTKTELRESLIDSSIFGENYVIPFEIAKKVAEKVDLNGLENYFIQDSIHDIESFYVVEDSFNTPILYIFNFVPIGMAVISADERHEPICAVVPLGKFEEKEVPSTLISWYEQTVHNIQMIKNGIINNTIRGKVLGKIPYQLLIIISDLL